MIFKAVKNGRSEEGLTSGATRPASLQMGLVGPTCHALRVSHGGPSDVSESFRVGFVVDKRD